jgi:hypothetical protein
MKQIKLLGAMAIIFGIGFGAGVLASYAPAIGLIVFGDQYCRELRR